MKKMKRNLLIASLLFTGAASAQFTQSNEPAIGTGQQMWELDASAPDFATATGAGQTWDYTAIPASTLTTRAFTVEDASTADQGTNFPSATKAIVIDGFMTTFISSTPGTRNSQGFSFDAGSPFNTVNAVLDTDDELLMFYPMALDAQLVDAFSGTAHTSSGNFPCSGNAKAIVDGTGTLKLNATTQYTNVTRFHLVDTAIATVPIVGQVKMIRSQYEYYEFGTNNDLPLFVYTSMTVVLGGSPTPTAYALSSAQPDETNSLNENTLTDITVYPNPATEKIAVKGLKNNAVLTLVDATGKTVATAAVEPAVASMNIANVTGGVYFLHITSNNQASTQRVIIR